jgi:predicted ArsR family transcriptional regulator
MAHRPGTRRLRDNHEGKPMSDSQTVTIPAAQHAATAETRPARLLRALAQNPEPLSTPALASILAEPGRRRRLLSAYDKALRRHEKADHVEQAGRERKGRGRPAIIWHITPAGRSWLDDHDKAPALAAAAAADARRAAAERDQALDEARATFDLQTPRISRKRAAHQLRELGCTLDQIGAVFHVSKERVRQDLLWDPTAPPAARTPPRKPKPRQRLTPRQTRLLLDLHQGHQAENYPPYIHTLRTLKNRGLVTYTAGSGPGSLHGYTLTTEGHAIASQLGGGTYSVATTYSSAAASKGTRQRDHRDEDRGNGCGHLPRWLAG